MSDVLMDDLLIAAAPVLAQAANSLPEHERVLLSESLQHGARLELRIMTEPTRVSLWVHGPAGEAFEASSYQPKAH